MSKSSKKNEDKIKKESRLLLKRNGRCDKIKKLVMMARRGSL